MIEAAASSAERQGPLTPSNIGAAITFAEIELSKAAGLNDNFVTGGLLPTPVFSEEAGYLEVARFFLASENSAFFAAAQARVDQMQQDLDQLAA